MAWGKVNLKEQKELFIQSYFENKFTLSDLCRQFDISRPTAYKWVERFKLNGPEGLKEHSKEPFHSPNKIPSWKEEEILKIKYSWPNWGPNKVLGHLLNKRTDVDWPSKTSIENIFKKHGLVKKRKLRKRFAAAENPLVECNSSNDIWCFDFKGWWITNDKQKCEPFTLMDAYSRYLICCQNMFIKDSVHVWAIMERLFKEHGLPLRVRSDNGPPFATFGAGRLSKLSIKLIKSGVMPEWIEPGEPQQNGRHERMHLTLKNEAVDLSVDLKTQIKKLNEFTEYYNHERPHEALNHKCPGDIYQQSSRYWDGKLRSPEYSNDYQIRKVKSCGKMSWKMGEVYVGRAFEGEPIGIKLEEGNLKAYYGHIFLGNVKDGALDFERRLGRRRK